MIAQYFRTVSTVWENYEVLANHFVATKEDQTCDASDRCKYEGLHTGNSHLHGLF